jgi:hypothetical protein
VTASGAVLDGASLRASTVDRPRSPDAELCIRAGYIALRRIADFFGVDHNPDPHWPEVSISIDRREFDQVCRELAEAGVPLKRDLEQAWRDFAGWRVNYDRVLLALAALTMAPYAPWSSDRSMIARNGLRHRAHPVQGLTAARPVWRAALRVHASVTVEREGWAWTH